MCSALDASSRLRRAPLGYQVRTTTRTQALQGERPMSVMTEADHRIPLDVASQLLAPAAYADERLQKAYAWLRKNEPLGVAEVEGVDPFWVVTRHADILEISRQ